MIFKLSLTTKYISILLLVISSFCISACESTEGEGESESEIEVDNSCEDCIKAVSCFPESEGAKLRICLSGEQFQCPEDSEDCFINIGEFYQVWRPLLEPTLDPSIKNYSQFINEDILVSGIFVDPDNDGDGGLPACSLPPLPTGPGTSIQKKDYQVLYASINTIEDKLIDNPIPNQEIIMYDYDKAHNNRAITITKFTNSINNISFAFDDIKKYYEDQIDDSELEEKPELLDGQFNLIGPSGSTTPYFYLDHQAEIRTYIVKMDENSILRIRCYRAEISDITESIEFYE